MGFEPKISTFGLWAGSLGSALHDERRADVSSCPIRNTVFVRLIRPPAEGDPLRSTEQPNRRTGEADRKPNTE
jgi:hypothetical protein